MKRLLIATVIYLPPLGLAWTFGVGLVRVVLNAGQGGAR